MFSFGATLLVRAALRPGQRPSSLGDAHGERAGPPPTMRTWSRRSGRRSPTTHATPGSRASGPPTRTGPWWPRCWPRRTPTAGSTTSTTSAAKRVSIRVLDDVSGLLSDLVAPPVSGQRSLVHASRRDLEVIAERHYLRRRGGGNLRPGRQPDHDGDLVRDLLGQRRLRPLLLLAESIVIAITVVNLVRTAASRRDRRQRRPRHADVTRSSGDRDGSGEPGRARGAGSAPGGLSRFGSFATTRR